MHRVIRRFLLVLAIVIALAGLWFGWLIYRLNAAAQGVFWQTKEGGLTLFFFPIDNIVTIYAGDDFDPFKPRTWVMTEPGGTRWPLAVLLMPSPEELFERAYTHMPDTDLAEPPKLDPAIGLRTSTAKGMVQLYEVVSRNQRANIVWQLEGVCKKKSEYCDALAQIQKRYPEDFVEVPDSTTTDCDD